MSRARVLMVALAMLIPAAPAAIATAGVARAAACSGQPGGPYPNDPSYAPAENGQPGQTWDSEDWYLYGCTPNGTAPLASDPQGASGMSVSDLWNRPTNPQRGNDQTVVAYMEGGVNWRIGTSCELKDRAQLNTGELPYPENAQGLTKPQLMALGHSFANSDPYDLNDDGTVNVEDYVNDPRVLSAVSTVPKSPGGGPFLHHVCSGVGPGFSDITPEDLIVAFGHCQVVSGAIGPKGCPANGRFDNDGNGYPNDINGWNFNRDNNDPQTEQSVYGHFDGESAQLVGEGNNANASVGMCPQCRYIPIKAGDEAIDRPDRVAEAIVYASDMGVSVMDVTDASLGLDPSVQGAVNYAYAHGMVVVFASNDFESSDHTDGMYYANVWPGNSLTGDHSTRSGATCPTSSSPGSPFCAFVESNTTWDSRSSLTSYGAHALFSVPTNDGSTSTATPTTAGVAALVVAEGKDAYERGQISSPLTPNEVRQVVRSTAMPISAPCPSTEPCFSAPSTSLFNIQYGYGRPNVLAAAAAIDSNQIPPMADITSPSWYQWVDPTKQASLRVSADVAAPRASGGAYTWELQYGLGPQPSDSSGWTTFATGSGSSPASVFGTIDLSQIPASFWGGAYAVNPSTRLSIEAYDVSVRVRVFANGDTTHPYAMGEDRRAFHLRHDSTELEGFPLNLGVSGESSPTMADIEGNGTLDTIIGTSDGSVHAIRPDGSEAPGFPVHTDPAPGMDPSYGSNYLRDPVWGNNLVPRPGDEIASSVAVGDLNHTGGLDIVASTLNGRTYAWDGLGRLLPGFPVLDGAPSLYGLSVPPPDTPYSFSPENVAFPAPVLAPLEKNGKLDIIQAAGDNAVHAYRPDGTPVPGWPVSVLLPPGTVPSGEQQTHDAKIIPTPAVVDINGDGIPDVVVGLDDSILGTGPSGAGVQTFLLAFDGRGNAAAGPVAGNPALLAGYPVKVPGLIQGYGVAQDFVTQGTESPAVYIDPTKGPQAVINANLFAQYTVDLKTATVSSKPFALATIPAAAPNSCPTPNSVPPTFSANCTLVPFTTSASLGSVLPGSTVPQAFQAGSSATDVFLGITQTPGFGIRVDNGIGGWDPASGANLAQYDAYIQGLGFFTAPAIADVTGDGIPDIIQSGDSSALTAIDGASGNATSGVPAGSSAAGFPKWTGGWSLFTPATGDVLGSGTTDVSVMTREGYLSIWSTAATDCAGNSQAWHWHQDDRNTGTYGTDTRPPSAINDLTTTRNSDGTETLSFTAVGNDWKCGTASSYQLFTSSQPIIQDSIALATPISVTKTPDPAGTKETITIPASSDQGYLAIRAVDAAGNIGPVAMSIAPATSVAEFGFGPALAVGGVVAALLGVMAPRRRRHHSRAR
ncbi:MAG: S8 family serine peptidase [Candidatus Dormibacteria bacterium]